MSSSPRLRHRPLCLSPLRLFCFIGAPRKKGRTENVQTLLFIWWVLGLICAPCVASEALGRRGEPRICKPCCSFGGSWASSAPLLLHRSPSEEGSNRGLTNPVVHLVGPGPPLQTLLFSCSGCGETGASGAPWPQGRHENVQTLLFNCSGSGCHEAGAPGAPWSFL